MSAGCRLGLSCEFAVPGALYRADAGSPPEQRASA